MRNIKTLKTIIITFVFVLLSMVVVAKVYAQPPEDYEKWSKIAIEETKKQHPNAAIVDYSYVQRDQLSSKEVRDIFQIRVTEGGKTFNIRAEVYHDPTTQKLLEVKLIR